MILILMGVSGSGKTTIGTLLAEREECPFADADDYHPLANKEKMRAGSALNDLEGFRRARSKSRFSSARKTASRKSYFFASVGSNCPNSPSCCLPS